CGQRCAASPRPGADPVRAGQRARRAARRYRAPAAPTGRGRAGARPGAGCAGASGRRRGKAWLESGPEAGADARGRLERIEVEELPLRGPDLVAGALEEAIAEAEEAVLWDGGDVGADVEQNGGLCGSVGLELSVEEAHRAVFRPRDIVQAHADLLEMA